MASLLTLTQLWQFVKGLWKTVGKKTNHKQCVCMCACLCMCVKCYQPCCVSDGSEDAAVAEDDDKERDEEDKDKEQHGVGADGGGERHVVPGARRHQALWDVGTCERT